EEDNDEQLDYRSINSNPHYYADDNLYKPAPVKQKPAATQSVKLKYKKPVPPSLDFNKLMKIAEEKEKEEKKPTLLEEIEYARTDENLFRAKRIEQKKRVDEQQKENLRRLNAQKKEESMRMKSRKEQPNRASITKQSTKESIPSTSGYSRTNNVGKPQRDSNLPSTSAVKKKPVVKQERYESESSEEERDDRFSSSRATLMPQKSQKNDLLPCKSVATSKLPNRKLPPHYDKIRTQERMIPKREPEKRIPLKKPASAAAVRPVSQKYTVQSSDEDNAEEYKPMKPSKPKCPEYVPQVVKRSYSPERYSPSNEYEKRLQKQKNLNSQKAPISYKPTKIKKEEYSDEEDDVPVQKVVKAPVNRNKYTTEPANLYERNKKQLQMNRNKDEYSPPPYKKSSVGSKRRDEEYSPTEPYMNGKKTANNLKAKQSDSYANYKPTSRQDMNRYSRDSESPESIRPPMKKQLPIGATYKKQNVRDSSPVHDKQANITTSRLLNNPSFGRLMQNKETERRNPNEARNKLSRVDEADERKIKMNAQRVMQQPVRKLPPIGLNYRRGMYGEKNDIEYQESDEEDEDDEEMREFIDDGDYEDVVDDDYSKYIREIFGYDKRKYVDEDDDDIMEANFEQQQKEELRSAKIGILEDLEDMRLEAEEKRLKAMREIQL
ncbi:protein SPT2-like protein, partial [Leptotrombidium deliense]